jgi:putative PEP-CTERM system response regulator
LTAIPAPCYTPLSMTSIILAIDDEKDMLETYRSILKKKYKILTAASGKEGLKIIQKESPALVLLDIRMPKEDGIQILKKIKEEDSEIEVIMVTASKDIASAVEAMKLGAFDYISKPFEVKELTIIVEKGLEKIKLIRENLYLKRSLDEASSYHDLIGKSPAMRKLYSNIESVAPTDSTILITGESGSGKELVARAIHNQSKRKDKPFVAVNCAAIPENLMESELFGHERGSFTGALERKIGKFELADTGTLFLDEIGCMPAPMQAKLLRVLEDRVIERVGGEKGVPVNIRIISATNIDFEKEIKEKRFREDLYYRLNVIPLPLPPLRDRGDDIILLANYFLDKFNKTVNKKVKGFSKGAAQAFLNYGWPGNVRELQNMVERVVVLSSGEIINLEELPFNTKKVPTDNNYSLKELITNYEVETIKQAISNNDDNITKAAQSMNMARTSLISRMKSLGMKTS